MQLEISPLLQVGFQTWDLGSLSTLFWRPSLPMREAFTGGPSKAQVGPTLTPPAALPAPVRIAHAPLLPPPAVLSRRIWRVLSLCHLVHVLLHVQWQLIFYIPIFPSKQRRCQFKQSTCVPFSSTVINDMFPGSSKKKFVF